MHILRRFVAGTMLGLLVSGTALAGERDHHGLAQEIVRRLIARRTSSAIHTTDFAGTDLGCIILPRRELHPFGYPGHAFLCEAAVSGEVLGAVLTRKGLRLCYITGAYAGDACYDLSICDNPERLCVIQ